MTRCGTQFKSQNKEDHIQCTLQKHKYKYNYQEKIKIIKKLSNVESSNDFGDRARALFDPQYLQKELRNIEEVFLENGFDKKEIKNSLKPRALFLGEALLRGLQTQHFSPI